MYCTLIIHWNDPNPKHVSYLLIIMVLGLSRISCTTTLVTMLSCLWDNIFSMNVLDPDKVSPYMDTNAGSFQGCARISHTTATLWEPEIVCLLWSAPTDITTIISILHDANSFLS